MSKHFTAVVNSEMQYTLEVKDRIGQVKYLKDPLDHLDY